MPPVPKMTPGHRAKPLARIRRCARAAATRHWPPKPGKIGRPRRPLRQRFFGRMPFYWKRPISVHRKTAATVFPIDSGEFAR